MASQWCPGMPWAGHGQWEAQALGWQPGPEILAAQLADGQQAAGRLPAADGKLPTADGRRPAADGRQPAELMNY